MYWTLVFQLLDERKKKHFETVQSKGVSNQWSNVSFFHFDVQEQIYRDPKGGLGQKNAWFSGDIHIGNLNTQTARAVDERLFEHVAPGGNTQLFNLVLDALEQEDYCQFEVQAAHCQYSSLFYSNTLYPLVLYQHFLLPIVFPSSSSALL